MVYNGKRSRACHMCRSRRIKCDEINPSCKQCSKAGLQCPGYNTNDKNTVLPSKAKRNANTQRSYKAAVMQQISGQRDKHRQNICLSLSEPITDQASSYFLSNFVLVAPQGTNRGFFEFVLPLITASRTQSPFLSAYQACSLAFLRNRIGGDDNLERQIIKLHTNAVVTTCKALQSPKGVIDDGTLGATLLLLLFETVTARNLQISFWKAHLEGAMQLIQFRGRTQLESKTGISLFTAVRTLLILFVLNTPDTPVNMGNEWWMSDTFKDKHAAFCQWLTLRTTTVRSEANTAFASSYNTKTIVAIIRKCQELDKGFVQWLGNLPHHYQYKTATWATTQDIIGGDGAVAARPFPGRIDSFTDPWIACIWNMMRCSRLELARLQSRCLALLNSPADYRTLPQYAVISKKCSDIITDMIASIPYQLGWFSGNPQLLGQPQTVSFACGYDGIAKSLSGFIAVWPLIFIEKQDHATQLQRDWAKGQLEYIGHNLGVRYATVVSHVL